MVFLSHRNPLRHKGLTHHVGLSRMLSMIAGGGIRTHMLVTQRRILSPLRLPFRHTGLRLPILIRPIFGRETPPYRNRRVEFTEDDHSTTSFLAESSRGRRAWAYRELGILGAVSVSRERRF